MRRHPSELVLHFHTRHTRDFLQLIRRRLQKLEKANLKFVLGHGSFLSWTSSSGHIGLDTLYRERECPSNMDIFICPMDCPIYSRKPIRPPANTMNCLSLRCTVL